jgi:chitin synthase
MTLSIADYIKLVVTGISFIDFIVFICLFLNFMLVIPKVATNTGTKITSVCIIFFFIVFKIMHIPMFLSTISVFNFTIPHTDIILGVLTWVNICLAGIPLWFALYTSFMFKDASKQELVASADKQVFIIMPIYNEVPEALWDAIESVMKLDYNLSLVHLYLCFDDDKPNDALLYIINKFELVYENIKTMDTIGVKDNKTGLNISILRLHHGGKKSAQYGGFKEISMHYTNLDESLVFFIDSDIVLQNDSLSQFTHYMKKYEKYCLTGMITCITSNKPNLLAYYQDIEYISGQVFTRNMETYLGATSCLPGAFTILKYSCLNEVAERYFTITEYSSMYDYHRFYLGEDRYLTHLLMEEYPWKIGFCQAAKCKTSAVSSISGLLKQRRRWALGHIANDTWMMSSVKLWMTYPLLSLFNLLNNSRNSSIYIYLLYFVLLLNKEVPVIMWIVFIILPIALNWLFITVYAFKTNRKMNIPSYVMILAFQPILSTIYMYYTIWTIRQVGWGSRKDEETDNKLNVEKETPESDPEMTIVIIE